MLLHFFEFRNIGYSHRILKRFVYFSFCLLLLIGGQNRILANEKGGLSNRNEKKQGSLVVCGVVVDSNNKPLVGASIVLKKNKTIGTITDIDGKFSLKNVSSGDVLIASFIGMKPSELKWNGHVHLKITLFDDVANLEGITAIGYATMKKKDLTGSVVSIDANKIARIPANDITASLVGVPGIRTTGGIRIRGSRSIKASNEPLIILDGMPYYENLQSINPEDIASIDVLKDASSTAIYGSQGANGVIIITTKKGQKGKTTVSYDGFVGLGTIYDQTFHAMDADEYVGFMREAYRAAGTWKSKDDDSKIFHGDELANMGKVHSDWVDKYLHTKRFWTSHTATITSGTEKTQYKLSMNYRYDGSRFKGAFNHSYFLNMDIDHQVASFMKLGVSGRLFYNLTKNKPDPLNSLLQTSPLIPIYDKNGTLNEDMGDPFVKNPFLTQDDDFYDDKSESWKAFIKAYVLFDIAKGLTFRSNFSYNYVYANRGYYYDDRYPGYNDVRNVAGIANNHSTAIDWNNILDYKKSFGKNHFDIMGVYEIQDRVNINTGASGKSQALSIYKWYNMGALMDSKVLSSSFARNRMISYVGSLHYDYDEKYLAAFTIRDDGASELSPQNRWDVFPSFAVGWRVSDESFMKNVAWLSNLKLRASYGITGNHAIAPYATLGSLNDSYLTFNTPSGEVHYVAMEPGIRPAPYLKWEKTRMLNIGLDFGVFNNRIWGTFDYYKSRTSDLLNQKKLPYTSGFDTAWDNVGKTQNTGYEVALNTIPIETKQLHWELNFTFYRNKEEMVELYDKRLSKDIQNGWWLGYPVSGVKYDLKQVGIWQKNEANLAALYGQKPGDVKVKDVNADGKIDGNDRVILGTDRPDWMGSISTTLNKYIWGYF